MSSERSVYRRVLRRETHSSRAGAAITVAVCLVLLFAAAGVACVLLIVHAPALAVVRAAFAEFSELRSAVRYPVLAAGIVLAALGLVQVILGVLPGRKSRRRLASDRCAIVADDDVIANAIADRVSSATGVERRRVTVIVGRRRASVRIVPTSGVPVDAEIVDGVATGESAEYGLKRPKVRLAERGVVG